VRATVEVAVRAAAQGSTYVDHSHVTAGTVIAILGVLGLLFGLFKRLILIGVVAVLLLVAGVVVAAVALHGTHCSPSSTRQVCISVR
jgi:hypothetical protein